MRLKPPKKNQIKIRRSLFYEKITVRMLQHVFVLINVANQLILVKFNENKANRLFDVMFERRSAVYVRVYLCV